MTFTILINNHQLPTLRIRGLEQPAVNKIITAYSDVLNAKPGFSPDRFTIIVCPE